MLPVSGAPLQGNNYFLDAFQVSFRTNTRCTDKCVDLDRFPRFLIAAGGVGLFGMDYVTWKRSEHFKGKRASVAVRIQSETRR